MSSQGKRFLVALLLATKARALSFHAHTRPRGGGGAGSDDSSASSRAHFQINVLGDIIQSFNLAHSDDGGRDDGNASPQRHAVVSSRRDVLGGAAALAAVATIVGATSSSSPFVAQHPDGASSSSVEADDRLWIPSLSPSEEALAESRQCYGDDFVLALTRFLLAYDASLRSWWVGQAASKIDPAAGSLRIEEARSKQLDGLAGSVRAGLAERFESSKEGARRLFSDLLLSYGTKGQVAAKQLCGIFSMLSPEYQPSELIGETLTELGKEFNLTMPRQHAVFSNPAVRFPQDRQLVELPYELSAHRTSTSEDVFVACMNGCDFAISDGRSRIVPPLTSALIRRERSLGAGIYARFFAAGAISSGLAHASLTPVDMLKTRLQTQPEKYGDGPIAAASTILEEEGPSAFMQGLGPTLAGYFLAGSIAFGGTEALKRVSADVLGAHFVSDHSFFVGLLCGAVVVATADLVVAPFEAARIRLVDDPDFAPNLPGALMRITMEEGGFYRGLPALLIKDVPFHATKFAAFDSVLSALQNCGSLVDLFPPSMATTALTTVSGMIAGVAAAIVSQPADATFTRCSIGSGSSEGDGGTEPLGPAEAFADLLKTGGIGAGMASRCIFGSSLVALQFLFYDTAKSLFQVATGDLTLFLDAFAGLFPVAS